MAVPFSENGGFLATTFWLFVPSQSSAFGGNFISIFDPSSFDDSDDGSSYSWRAEDIVMHRVPTVRRVILVYRDLGVATITVSVGGTNDNGNVVSAAQTIKIGTAAATGSLITKFSDLTITCFRPQLTISRAAGAGPVSIISATMVGEVEEGSL